MPELEDLRGTNLNGFVSPRLPLLCALGAETGGVGHLIQGERDDPIRASIAGVRWTIDHGPAHDRIEFEEGPFIAEAYVGLHGYEAEIDGTARYRYEARRATFPESRYREAWVDALGRHVVLFRRETADPQGRTGAILTSATATLEHVPVLALLGVVHLTMRTVRL